MNTTVRPLKEGEGPWLKQMMVSMTTEMPTAFAAKLADLEQRTDDDWQERAGRIAASEAMRAFVAENSAEPYGFVGGSILTEARLAEIERREANGNGDTLSDTTLLGSMWVAPQLRSQGLGQELIQAVLGWAREKNQRRVMLAVTEGNDRALRCYTRANFVPTNYSLSHPSYPELYVHFMEYIL